MAVNPVEYIPTQQAPPTGYTQGQIEQQRAIAKALMEQKSGSKPFGLWGGIGQGLEDASGKIMGSLMANQADKWDLQRQYMKDVAGENLLKSQPQAAPGGAASPPPFRGEGEGRSQSGPQSKEAFLQPASPTRSTSREQDTEGPDAVSQAAMRLTAQGETGKRGSAALFNISSDTGGSKSYGPFGLNSKTGSAAQFAKEHPELGLTAAPGSVEFDGQWNRGAATNKDGMKKAHEDWYKKNIMGGLTESMTKAGVDPRIASDPRVQIYMSDRKSQMGTAGLNTALNYARQSNSPEEFIRKVSQVDKQRIPYNFPSYLRDHPNNVRGLSNRVDLRHGVALGMGGAQPAEDSADRLAAADPAATGKFVNSYLGRQAADQPTQVAQSTPPQVRQQPGLTQQDVADYVGFLGRRGGGSGISPEEIIKYRLGLQPQYEVGQYGQVQRTAPGEVPGVVGMMPGFPGVLQEEKDLAPGMGTVTKYDPRTGTFKREYLIPTVPSAPQAQAPVQPAPRTPTAPQAPQGATVQAPTQPAPTPKTAPQAITSAPAGGPLVTPPPQVKPATTAPAIAAKPGQQLAMADIADIDPFGETVKGGLKGGASKLTKFAQAPIAKLDLNNPKTEDEVGAKEALDWADANPPKQLMMRNALTEAFDTVRSPTATSEEKIDALANIKGTRTASEKALEDKMKAQDKGFAELQKAFRDSSTQSLKLAPETKLALRILDSPGFQSGPANELITLGRGLREELGRLSDNLAKDAVKRGDDPGIFASIRDWALDPENRTATANQVYTKILSGAILQSLRGMLGPNAGQFRVQELRMLEQAFGNPNLTLDANKTVMGMIDKINDRNILIGKMADTYAKKHGGLDASFEEALSDFEQQHPVFSPEEYDKLIGIVATGKTDEEQPAPAPAPAPSQGIPGMPSLEDIQRAKERLRNK